MRLTDFVDPYRLKRFLIMATVVACLVVVILLVTLLGHKVYVEMRAKRLKRLRELYIAAISRKLVEPDVAIEKPEGTLQHEALGDVFIDMLASISGDMEARVKAFARDLGMDTYYAARAVSGSWVRRLIAIEKLGFLKLQSMKGFFRSLLLGGERDTEILARTVLAFSFVADEEYDLRIINDILKNPLFRSSKFNEYVYTNIIKSFIRSKEDGTLLRFLDALTDDPSLPVMLKRDIIEACGSETFYQARDIIMKYFRRFQDTPEMKIACIRALGRIGGESVCKLMGSCLEDGDWRVRAVTAKNAYLCSEDIVEQLHESLHDENYFVRVNAALSLSKLGDRGLAALQEAARSSDRFTVDVSRYILNEVRLRA